MIENIMSEECKKCNEHALDCICKYDKNDRVSNSYKPYDDLLKYMCIKRSKYLFEIENDTK